MTLRMNLPISFEVELDRDTRVLDGGCALLGGSPIRLLRLTERARSLLAGRRLSVRDAAGAALADRLVESGMAHPVAGALPPLADAACTFVIPVRDRPRELDRLLVSVRISFGDGAAGSAPAFR